MHSPSTPPHTRAIFLCHAYAHTLYIHRPFSLTHAHTLSRGVSHTHALYISHSLLLLSMTLFTNLSHKHYFSHMHAHAWSPPAPPLYISLPRVSRTHTLFSPLSHALSPPLLLVDRYDSIRSFGRISLTVKVDGDKRQRFSQVGALAIEEIPYSWSCILWLGCVQSTCQYQGIVCIYTIDELGPRPI
jgi:hypothetical protein